MKDKLLILIAVLFTISGMNTTAEAQLIYEREKQENFFYPTYEDMTTSRYVVYSLGVWQQNGKHDAEEKQKNAIKSIDYTSYKAKRSGNRKIQKYRHIRTYDRNGRLLTKQRFYNGKEKRLHEFTYNKDGWYTNYKRTIRGRKTFEEKMIYDQNNYVLDYRKYKNGAFKSKWSATYNDTMISSQVYYKKDSVEIRSNWEYDYYPDNQKKETRYFAKGKLKHRWSYSCDEEGKEIKKKGESQVCELKQYNADSTYVIIKRFTGRKGKISKQRYTYDKQDRLILTEHENVRGKIVEKHETKYDQYGHIKASYEYGRGKRSNKIRWGERFERNAKGEVLASEWIWKAKLRSRVEYTRNLDGNVLTSITKKADGELRYRSVYEYNEKGLVVSRRNYNKDNELTRVYLTSYQYY